MGIISRFKDRMAEKEAEYARQQEERREREEARRIKLEECERREREYAASAEFYRKRAEESEARAYILEHGIDAYNEYAIRKETERHNREMEAAALEQARAILAGMANMAATMSAREEVSVASTFEDSRRERAKTDYKNAIIEASVRRSIGDNKFADYKEAQAKRYIADIL